MKKILIGFILLIGAFTISAQRDWKKNAVKVAPPVCYASDKVERVAIPPSSDLLNRLKSGEKRSNIIVDYRLFPSEARSAFEYAVGLWETIIESPVPIYVRATWSTLGEGVLGSCGPYAYYENFENTPHENRFYPVAIVEKITGAEITGVETPDITANFSKSIDWYFGTDLNTPDSLYDFVTVVLHELGHGLGFTGFFFVSGEDGAFGYEDFGDAAAFDLLIVNRDDKQLIDTLIFPNESPELKEELTSNFIYANSPVAIAEGAGALPRLFAPNTWDDGSSIYHLNDFTYPASTGNSLMTPTIGKAEAVHDPGPITRGIMADIGWMHMYLDFEELKDIEEKQSLSFEVNIESDYKLDTASVFLIYSTDTFQTQIDTILLQPTETNNLFAADVTPDIELGSLHYYISAKDEKERIFRLPTEAPSSLYSLNIGPDSELPVIEHQPIAYYLATQNGLMVSAFAEDNLGIDSVYVQYDINGTNQNSFELVLDSANTYIGNFNFDENLLNDGDVINYKIVAQDASLGKNKNSYPKIGSLSFNIEKLGEPVSAYINNFDSQTNDFIISDFDIYTESGFENAALHSPHPYPSPGADNEEYNFSTILKRPIILKKSGTITFDEIVLVEPGESNTNFGDDEFWDYAVVEGSNDMGKTWVPLADGYDSKRSFIWLNAYNDNLFGQNSGTVGSPDLYISNSIDLIEQSNFEVGDTVLIKFRLYSDPYAHGWGWAIDNLRIQQPVSAQLTELSPGNIMLYPNPFEDKLNLIIDKSNTTVREIRVDFYNVLGQIVKTVQLGDIYGQTTRTIDLSEFTEGMYLVNILEDGQQVTSRKLIKK